MPTEVIPIGRPHTMITNREYACPASRVLIHASGLGLGAIEVDDGSTIWTTVTLDDDENFECAASFIRCTTALDACVITAKKH